MPTYGYRGKRGGRERNKQVGAEIAADQKCTSCSATALGFSEDLSCSVTVLPLIIVPLWNGAWQEMEARTEDGARRENKAWSEFFLRGIKDI